MTQHLLNVNMIACFFLFFQVACTFVAALLHLFFMAAFAWMLVEGLLLWSKVVAVNLSEDRHMKYYYLIGWGTKASSIRPAQFDTVRCGKQLNTSLCCLSASCPFLQDCRC